jgi:tRNA threonylcarbamoyladenosine biosynthesis protein TsaE
MTTSARILKSNSPALTEKIGELVYQHVPKGSCIALFGELGAGKTCLTRGITRANESSSQVSSPTFTLINEYSGTWTIYHMDLYRLNGLDELLDIGLDEALTPQDGICVLEWAERAQDLLPEKRVEIHLSHAGRDDRTLEIKNYGVFSDDQIDELENQILTD